MARPTPIPNDPDAVRRARGAVAILRARAATDARSADRLVRP